ncbi:MAG TPA: aspartate--ammonia ligase [Clostridiales bacterium]|nr:aspartate--ammonia ligase [Clostridiales bacterium]
MRKEISYLETLKAIDECKKHFESQLEVRLGLTKVQSPIFVKTSTGLQDKLTGVEKAVSFKKEDEKFEIVHSLAKWKRVSLGKYKIPMHEGIYTDMKAIRKDEVVDDIHSLYVEQWDWEKVIDKQDRTIEYLKDTVKSIYKAIRQTSVFMKKKYHYLTLDLPKTIYFITSQELEDMYPDKMPIEREQLIGKEKKAVFIIGIGDKLKSGVVHDKRSPDYDDWKLDGDLLIYDKAIDKTIEISSMGIRVDETSLKEQLEKSRCMDRLEFPYHQKILKKELPYTIGGGIGQSRILMLILEKEHIAEVQASSWEEKTELELKDMKIL